MTQKHKTNTSSDETPPKTILLIGGGSGGHILPLKPLIQKLSPDHKVHLIVGNSSLDKKIIQENFSDLLNSSKGIEKIYYFDAYKIHYHFSPENFVNILKILKSFLRAKKLLTKIDPDVIFFKGGFVGFPFLVAAKILGNFKGKIFLHESDISSGKLTQLFAKYADKVFLNFGEKATPLFYWPSSLPEKMEKENPNISKLPKILIFGGSQGAQFLNNLILQNLSSLTSKYHIILVTGPNNKIPHVSSKNFQIYSFLSQDQLINEILNADLIIARSGASIFQVLAAQKKLICIPLPTAARNHQLHNAQYFEKKGVCYLLEQNENTSKKLLPTIAQILNDKALEQRLKKLKITEASAHIAKEISR